MKPVFGQGFLDRLAKIAAAPQPEFRFDPEKHKPWATIANQHVTPRMKAARARYVARSEANARVSHARMVSLVGEAQAAREARGLVSLSTTCKADGSGLSVVDFMAENTIEIDHQKARITRMQKSVGISAKALHHLGEKNQRVWMLTLTYAGTNRNWRPEHISRYLDGLRKWHYSRTGIKKVRYVWVAELQKRGVIHYHVCVWLNHGLTPPKPDSAWKKKGAFQAPMWTHGMSNRVRATHPVAYLMKYASKGTSEGKFPHGARISGVGGLDEIGRGCRRWVLWPAYVQGNASIKDRFRPAPGGGYLNAKTGELLRSEFVPTGGGFTRFVRVRTTPRSIENTGGPFSWLSDKPGVAHA
ncbi:hypothetical protein [Comamonas sp. 26]|uniref:rolling circle replication-associated protein n=1 Tax=Comamonas sp. 26 TaxID=2035201 RepID=UPI000C3C4EA5|nr:hypothetical protein [Comamonas sp. 26]PIG08627.1 hypothetical protein CLU84_1492 [Comamonas sp. 26]PIG08996.1 hypothetical protein CLU84_1876 [Comamonas sp. 26]